MWERAEVLPGSLVEGLGDGVCYQNGSLEGGSAEILESGGIEALPGEDTL